MKVKMKEHNGVVTLVVVGATQDLIITEEDGCFAVEMVNTTPSITPVYIKEEVPTANMLPLVLEDDTPQAPSDNDLFKKLVQLRKQLAAFENIAPYLIFHDKTLREMVDKAPMNMQEMGTISGVGQAKLEKYGSVFLEAIHGIAV